MAGLEISAVIAGVAGTASVLRELVDGKQSKDVLRERLLLAADRLDLAKEQITQLEAELAAVREKLADLGERDRQREAEHEAVKLRLDAQSKGPTFEEHAGVLVKILPDGRLSENAHCPSCRKPLAEFANMLTCAEHGGWIAPLGPSAWKSLLTKLRADRGLGHG